MKKLVAMLLLSAGFASHIVPSDHSTEPGYGQGCNVPEPSPPATPRGDDSNDKK